MIRSIGGAFVEVFGGLGSSGSLLVKSLSNGTATVMTSTASMLTEILLRGFTILSLTNNVLQWVALVLLGMWVMRNKPLFRDVGGFDLEMDLWGPTLNGMEDSLNEFLKIYSREFLSKSSMTPEK